MIFLSSLDRVYGANKVLDQFSHLQWELGEMSSAPLKALLRPASRDGIDY